ncbi:MAG: hypothetical protein JSS27_01295 [Planctomycetes bacterium]|nr:hypothetical protein [Planctomycetota bacterium]
MAASRDELLAACLQLPENDRLVLAEQLLGSLPEELPGLSLDDPQLLEELKRRANDGQPDVALSELWKRPLALR